MISIFLFAMAFAQNPTGMSDDMMGGGNQPGPSTQKSTADYLMDLDGEDSSDRLLAARVLRGQLRRALKAEDRAREGSLAYDDARSLLVELDERLPEACLNALAYSNVVAPCAEMLAMLEIKEAIPRIEQALALETNKRKRERIEAALAELRALP
jgi:hypothetical protein